MQAASPVRVVVQRFGRWNMAIGLVSVLTVSVVAAWLNARNEEVPGWSGMLLIAAVLVGMLGVIDLLRRRPIALRWDAQRWHVTDPSRVAGEIEVSELRVVLDLGDWMLLKFRADVPQHRLRGGWIPVQRHGTEIHWQSFRCAVFAHGTAWIRPTAPHGQAQRG